jgi:hypothetical protein
MIPFSLVSQAIGLGSASGTRAGLSLLAVAVASHLGYVTLPPDLAWMAHPGALGGFAVVLAFEMSTQRDEDVRMLMGLVQYGLSGTSGALGVLATLDVPAGNVPEWALGAGGALLAVGSLALRRRLHAAVADLENELFHPQKWLHRLEEGGALGVCIAVFLAPFLALALVLLAALAGLVGSVAARRLEARFRRPCPACAAAIRQEASRCPKCRAEVEVARQLDGGLAGTAPAALQRAVTRALAHTGRREPHETR